MEEELIAFETAQLAHQKGFTWPSLYYDNADGERFFVPYAHRLPEGMFWAPSQSLLNRWLKDQHGFYVEVYPEVDFVAEAVIPGKWLYYVVDLRNQHRARFMERPDGTIAFANCELALETGLFAALTLLADDG
jgi:hypothetical protein